jgi:hypothetical protein
VSLEGKINPAPSYELSFIWKVSKNHFKSLIEEKKQIKLKIDAHAME